MCIRDRFHDIRSKDIFTSPYYYLQQNDIVYVEPTNMKATEQAQRKLSTWSKMCIRDRPYALSVMSAMPMPAMKKGNAAASATFAALQKVKRNK